MSRKKSLVWFAVSLLLIVISYSSAYVFKPEASGAAEKLEEQYRKQIELLEQDLQKLSRKYDQITTEKLYSLCNKNSYFIYSGDSLIFWSKDVSEFSLKTLNSDQKVIQSANAWYYKSSIQQADTTFLGLLLLQYDFPFQNEFLRNNFNPAFHSAPFESINKVGKGYKITDKNGQAVFYLNPKKSFSHNTSTLLSAAFLLLGLFFFFSKIPRYLFNSNLSRILFIIFSAILFRFFLFFQLPSLIKSTALFNEKWFAINEVIPSLGDFLLHILFLFILIYQFKKLLRTTVSKPLFLFFGASATLFSALSVRLIFRSIRASVINYDFSNLFELNYLSFVAFICFCLLFIICLMLVDICIHLLKNSFPKNRLLFLFLAFTVGLITSFILYRHTPNLLTGWLLIPFLLLFYKILRPQKQSILIVIVLLLYSSAVLALSISFKSESRNNKQQKNAIKKLAEERDPIAEYLFNELQDSIRNDKRLKEKAAGYWNNKVNIDEYLNRKYFNSYWEKYQIQYSLCSPADSLFANTVLYSCSDYFQNRIRQEGDMVSSTNLFQLRNFAGRIDYIGEIKIPVDSVSYSLFIELSSVYLNENEGYPELLIDEKSKSESLNLLNTSYAVYDKNKLVYKNGDFNYSTILKINELSVGNFYQYRMQDFQHFVYQKDRNTTLMLSKPSYGYFSVLTSLAYIAIILSIFFLVFSIVLFYFPFHFELNLHDFSTKIQLFLIGFLLSSLVLLAWGTTYYIEKQYQQKNSNNLNEKIRSVNLELESKIGKEEYLAEELEDYVSEYLIKFSNVFYSDINLYTKNGLLYSTSRPEVFVKGLKSKQMNPAAFKALSVENKAQWTQEENIGKMKYLSTYIPFKNYNNEVLGYLNLPYFARQGELEEEISSFLVSTLNIYVAIFALALLISVILINQLSKPLLLIRKQISKLKLGSSIELIDWKSKDEIGALVKEYNRIAIELNESAEQLARSEREVAWREMAKQVAHEIKNPLTPMKLSIQHLQMAAEAQSDDLEARIKRTTEILIEQIETLSGIATAFSSFARLPGKNYETLKIVPIIKNTIDLYSHDSPIGFKEKYHLNELEVKGDKDQLLRVFNNLIKNAVQATEALENPRITVEVYRKNKTVEILIIDNGVGISDIQAERIFEPNFTTKSSGTGLGLAMSKSIVEQMGGTISFHSVESRGTTFKVVFPLA